MCNNSSTQTRGEIHLQPEPGHPRHHREYVSLDHSGRPCGGGGKPAGHFPLLLEHIEKHFVVLEDVPIMIIYFNGEILGSEEPTELQDEEDEDFLLHPPSCLYLPLWNCCSSHQHPNVL